MEKIELLGQLLKAREEQAILQLVKAYPSVLSQKNEQGIAGLMLIAYYKLPNVLQEVLPLKEDLTFHEAVACGDLEGVKDFLAQEPTLLNQASPDGFPPLCLACYFGQRANASYLLEAGADINAVATNGSNIQALHAAVAKNDVQICEWLLEKGAAVNATQTQGVTALHSAVHRGNMTMIKLLVQHGADKQAKMDNGDTPISIAEREGQKEILTYLNS